MFPIILVFLSGWKDTELGKRLREILRASSAVRSSNSYDVIGDVAIICLTGKSMLGSSDIAEAIMSIHKNVKTVLAQTSPITGDYRLRKLAYVAGENKTLTTHKESGCLFAVDLERCYFSPRLFHERKRVAGLVKTGEVVVNMFAGVGCFSIIIAKHSDASKVFSIDINPLAVHYMQENVRINGVYGRVIPILGDAKQIIEQRFHHSADRVLMPLPEKALEYLPCSVLALKESGGWIHYYDFAHATKTENPVDKVKRKVAEKLQSLKIVFQIPYVRVVRTVGPNWCQIVLDVWVNG
jgi:tRNA (guanine37-N1)-methyltransferase